jgi:DNA helicase-2/ATP-dependent DNA helicase PcrA
LDSSDSEDVINILRSNLKFDKTKRRFPTKTTIYKIISMARNTREKIEKIIEKDYPGYEDVAEEINLISIQYREYKAKHQLMDYDDLLVHLLNLMKNRPDIRKKLNDIYRYIMVDEYQDTNRLQHEIVLQLAGDKQNIMAVGDDAQSIYAFRGADYQNILFFPKSFDNCVVYKIEQNYRSTTPILDLSNEIIKTAAFKYEKELYSDRIEGDLPIVVATNDEREQSDFVAQQILEYREQGIELSEIAVLFRSSFHSFDLEIWWHKICRDCSYQRFTCVL